MMTIPSLFPEVGTNDTTDLPLQYDSTAARGLSSLASRITDAVFPPSGLPLFELVPNRARNAAASPEDQNILNGFVRAVTERLSLTNLRSCFTDSNEKMLCGGLDLIWFHDDWTFSSHSLEDFVVRRQPNGKVTYLILCEWLDPDALPEDWKNVPAKQNSEDEECCYTEVRWDQKAKAWNVRKEFRDVIVSSGKAYKYQPFVLNGWRLIPRDHYCRSFVEENEGDIRMAEVLGKSLKECSIITSKLVMGVDPAGQTEIQDFVDTENGAVIAARKDDVFPIQATSPAQMQTIQAALANYRRDLGKTFLDPSSIQRNGDRVTATEWTVMVRQLGGTLGPNFSSKAEDIQNPIIRRAIALMADANEIPSEILKQIEPGNLLQLRIRTGLTSLQQEIEAQELEEFATVVGTLPFVASEVNGGGWLQRYIAAKRWDPKGIVKTPEEKAAEAQQAMQMQAVQQGIQSIGKIAETGAKQSQ